MEMLRLRHFHQAHSRQPSGICMTAQCGRTQNRTMILSLDLYTQSGNRHSRTILNSNTVVSPHFGILQ
ncbi:hypothetical protein EJ05DRAFT_479325 [Pseudovirgaria hyperparasitica]|uniref:Uncharacterized protein n=1 Tax=Pseudovirgaria hyperparasitica TaxID=470096 RepID=A0A6A6VW51_9PEZI|nr:uncharacterized protein EJ05DRAFT_479325 [Pseudovirgaria hyperparasitica]KAF2754918.1 hypothetical protein EJ05DRAFT_479325 [Pseudovirgaria hyperparasitica]